MAEVDLELQADLVFQTLSRKLKQEEKTQKQIKVHFSCLDHAKYTCVSGALVGEERGGPPKSHAYNTSFVLCIPRGGESRTYREVLVSTLTLKSLDVVLPVLTMGKKKGDHTEIQKFLDPCEN